MRSAALTFICWGSWRSRKGVSRKLSSAELERRSMRASRKPMVSA
jgi:hypothetical protein